MKTVLKLLVLSAIISPSIALAKPIRTVGPNIVEKKVKEHESSKSTTESVGSSSDDHSKAVVKHDNN